MIKEAFLLAAGLGTRLRPITENLPKPLVKVGSKTLLEWNLEMLMALGCKKVVINAFYLKDQLRSFVQSLSLRDMKVIISEEDKLLDTGGGLKNAWKYFDSERIYSWNSDILLDPKAASSKEDSILNLVRTSLDKNPLPVVTLLVAPILKEEEGVYTKLIFDKDMGLAEFLGKSYGPVTKVANESGYKYLGISVISNQIEPYLRSLGDIFSLTRDVFPLILESRGREGIR